MPWHLPAGNRNRYLSLMIILSLVIALVAERFLGPYLYLRQFAWFEIYAQRLRARFKSNAFWDGPLGIVATLALPLLVVAIVQYLLQGVVLNLLALVFGVLMLLYCLGPRDLDADSEAYTAAVEEGDEARAQTAASDLLGGAAPPDPWTRTRAVTDAILSQSNERLFGVVFWYAVLGPLGAALFRLAAVLRDNALNLVDEEVGYRLAALRLYHILGWLPARLVALSYALSGSFEDAMQGMSDFKNSRHGEFADANAGLLVCAGNGALRLDADGLAPDEQSPEAHVTSVKAALGLMWRTLIIWLGVLLLLGFAGWAR